MSRRAAGALAVATLLGASGAVAATGAGGAGADAGEVRDAGTGGTPREAAVVEGGPHCAFGATRGAAGGLAALGLVALAAARRRRGPGQSPLATTRR